MSVVKKKQNKSRANTQRKRSNSKLKIGLNKTNTQDATKELIIFQIDIQKNSTNFTKKNSSAA